MRASTALFLVLGTAVGAPLGAPAIAQAQTPDAICFNAAAEGQRARNEGRLREAKASFVQCAAASCDPKVVARCVGWLADVEAATPSVIVRAKDATGQDLHDVDLLIDGRVVERLSPGSALELDPGQHELRLTARGEVAQRTIVLHEREKARIVDVVFPAKSQPPPRPFDAAPWIFGGVAVAAAGVATYFGVSALDDRSAFGCAKGCSQAQADSVSTRFVVADVLALTAVLAGGVAAWFAFSKPTPTRTPTTAHRVR